MAIPDIRPLKPPLVPGWTAVDVALVALEAVLVALSCAWVLRSAWTHFRTRSRPARGRAFDAAAAIGQLHALHAALPAETDRFYSSVSTLVRECVTAHCEIPAAALSSTELVVTLERAAASSSNQQIAEMLRIVDAVRFGRLVPTDDEAQVVLQHATRCLRQIR